MNKDTDYIVRYCRPTQCQDGIPCVTAFQLRKKNAKVDRPEDERELSVNHFEFYDNDNYKHILHDVMSHGLQTNKNGCFAKIKYKSLETAILSEMKILIDIIPEADNSHCLISNLYQNDITASYCFVDNIEEVVFIRDIE